MGGRKRGRSTTWREVWPIWLTFGILFGSAALGVWVILPSVQPTVQIPTRVLLQGEDVTLDLGALQPNVPRLFTYPMAIGQSADYFVEHEEGNKISVAFASCRRCYRAGHYRRGGQILCGRCNEPMVRATAGQTLATEKDCTNIPIAFERSGDRLIIRADAVGGTFVRWYGPLSSLDRDSANGIQQ